MRFSLRKSNLTLLGKRDIRQQRSDNVLLFTSGARVVGSVIGGDSTLTSSSVVDTVAIRSLMALSGPYLITDQTRAFSNRSF